MITIDEAKEIVLAILDKGSVITAELKHDDEYLFFVIRPDLLEGRFDPFIKIHSETGAFSDWSPQDYPEPRAILDPMVKQADAFAARR